MPPRIAAGDVLTVEPELTGTPRFARHVAKATTEFVPYLWGALATLVSAEVALVARPYLELADIIMLHLIGVVVIATRFDMAVSVFTAVASVLAFDFVFVPPEFVLSLPDVKSVITCGGMLTVAVVISGLTTRARRFELTARSREARTALQYELCRELVEARGAEELMAVTVRRFEEFLGQRVALLVPDAAGTLRVVDARGSIWLSHAEVERATLAWRRGPNPTGLAGRHARSAGAPLTHFLFLSGASTPLGLLAVRGPAALFADATEREFFEVCGHQAALAIERAGLAEKAASAELAAKREHVHNALLRSISHDFRTPLAAIVGAGMSLSDYGSALAPDARALLERTIVEQGQRLHRLLTNVLSATRLDGGELRLEKTPCSLDEIVESALRHLGEAASKRPINVSLPFELPLVDIDPLLFEQLVVNVLENALRYAPEDEPIEIAARCDGTHVLLSIADRGPGIAPGDAERVFEKFYRGPFAAQGDGGLGLGLTICQAVAQVHGGRIDAVNRAGGGLCVTTALPRALERTYPSSPLDAAQAREP
jgi:two-component system, OmpR family, sensor histidine kinase KdpD